MKYCLVSTEISILDFIWLYLAFHIYKLTQAALSTRNNLQINTSYPLNKERKRWFLRKILFLHLNSIMSFSFQLTVFPQPSAFLNFIQSYTFVWS